MRCMGAEDKGITKIVGIKSRGFVMSPFCSEPA